MGREALLSASLVALAFASCGEPKTEGANPGECSDKIDNDEDGFFDCNDSDCLASTECTGESTDQPTDSEEAIAAFIRGVTVDYTLTFSFTAVAGDVCALAGLCDCTNVYRGTGTSQAEASGTRVTLAGTWELVDSDCSSGLEGAIWVPDNGNAYHSFTFDDDLGRLQDWVVHGEQDGWLPRPNAMDNEQYYLTEMSEPYSRSSNRVDHYEESSGQTDDGLVTIDNTHTLTIVFSE